MAMCLKIIFIRNVQFRTQKGFQNLRKVKTAYTKLQQLSIETIIKNLHSSIIIDFNTIQLPSRQTIEYLLVKLQSLSKILCRIISCTKQATHKFLTILSKGFFVELVTLLLGILSGIWAAAIGMCKMTVKYYNKIRCSLEMLKPSKQNWLPNDYILPKELGKWLGDEWIDEINVATKKNVDDKKSNKIEKLLKLNDNMENEDVKNESRIDNSSNVLSVNKLLQNDNELGCEVALNEILMLSDMGEEIPRKKF